MTLKLTSFKVQNIKEVQSVQKFFWKEMWFQNGIKVNEPFPRWFGSKMISRFHDFYAVAFTRCILHERRTKKEAFVFFPFVCSQFIGSLDIISVFPTQSLFLFVYLNCSGSDPAFLNEVVGERKSWIFFVVVVKSADQ